MALYLSIDRIQESGLERSGWSTGSPSGATYASLKAEGPSSMVTEYRKIAFSNGDLIQALIDFDRQRTKQFAPGREMTCTIKDEEPVSVLLSIADPAGGAPNVFEFDSNHLAAVLLCFCINRKVPIPKQAKKVLRAMGDGLSLNFKLNLSAEA